MLGETAFAAGDLELGREITSQNDPRSAALASGQFNDGRLTAADGEAGAELLPARSRPGKFQDTIPDFGFQAIQGFVFLQIAIDALAEGGGGHEK